MSLPSHRRVHLDSSVYLAFLKGETIPAYGGMNRVGLAEFIFDAGEAGLITVLTSTITLVEVRRGVDSPSASEQSRISVIDSLFDRSSTYFIDVDRAVALSARRIANQYGIGTTDAIQVASADAARCSDLFIWDNRIVSKFSADPLPGLSVRDPYPESTEGMGIKGLLKG